MNGFTPCSVASVNLEFVLGTKPSRCQMMPVSVAMDRAEFYEVSADTFSSRLMYTWMILN